jgi:hypothetical protein
MCDRRANIEVSTGDLPRRCSRELRSGHYRVAKKALNRAIAVEIHESAHTCNISGGPPDGHSERSGGHSPRTGGRRALCGQAARVTPRSRPTQSATARHATQRAHHRGPATRSRHSSPRREASRDAPRCVSRGLLRLRARATARQALRGTRPSSASIGCKCCWGRARSSAVPRGTRGPEAARGCTRARCTRSRN